MEERLFEAARTENVDYMIKSMESNPIVLEVIVINGGKSPLHVASMYEVIDLLLGCGGSATVPNGLIEVNYVNSSDFTALDVLLHFGGEPGNAEIQEILYEVGAIRARDEARAQELTHPDSNTRQTTHDRTSESPENNHKQWLDYFKDKKDRDSPSDVRNTLLVIAILIATATYQAALSPPGGVWQEDYCINGSCYIVNGENRKKTAGKLYSTGTSIAGSKNWVSYGCFVFLNSVGFFASLELISLLSTGFPFRLELRVPLTTVGFAHGLAIAALPPSFALSLFFTILPVILPIIVSKVPSLIRNHVKNSTTPSVRRSTSTILNTNNQFQELRVS